MGIIRRQGLNASILIYLGFALGAVNILVLFPKYLTLEQSGLIFLFVALAKIVQGFASFGNTAIMNKFFPYYNDFLPKEKNDFLVVSLILPLIGILLTCCVWYFAEGIIIRKTLEKSPLLVEYYYLALLFIVTLILYSALEVFSYTRLRTEFPTLLREIGLRLIITAIIFLLAFSLIDFSRFVMLYSLSYAILILAIVIYLYKKKDLFLHFRYSHVTRRLKRMMASYGLYIYGGIIISALAENADTFIIGSLAGLGNIAIYQTGHYISTLIQVPYRSISAISSPIIAKAWKDKDLKLIESIYYKTSLNQLIAALLIFLSIWLNIQFVLDFLGNAFVEVKMVVLLLGITRVIDLCFGLNSEILNNSKYWRFNFISYVMLVLLFLPTNYVLVKLYGIYGSALSNLISYFLFNLVRFLFLYIKCNLQPFSIKHLWALACFIPGYLICDQLIDFAPDSWFQTIVKTICFVAISLGLLLWFRVSEAINDFVGIILKRITNTVVWRRKKGGN